MSILIILLSDEELDARPSSTVPDETSEDNLAISTS